MKILVTGASGRVGRVTVADLREHGHEVLGIDQAPSPDGPDGGPVVDLADFGQVVETMSGVDDRLGGFDAVVHLGAVPAPGRRPNAAIFANNAVSGYNVLAAARMLGIAKVVWASSETVLGLPFETPPPYLPVDEEYVVRPETIYSLGKAVEEEMARHFARWQPDASIIGLRFSNVLTDDDYARFDAWQDDPAARAWNLWGYIDHRDAAQAVRLAVEADARRGAEVFIVAADDTVMRRPSAELLTGPLAELERRAPLEGRATLLSNAKAKRELGFQPAYSWVDRVPRS